MFRPANYPTIRHDEEVPDNNTFHAREFLHAGEQARPWSEENCGHRARSLRVPEYSRARPATRRRTHSAAATPRRTSARGVLRPAARVRKNPHASLPDHMA